MITVGVASIALGGGLLSAPTALAQETTGTGLTRTVATQSQHTSIEKRPKYRPCKYRIVYWHKHYTKHGKKFWHKHVKCLKRYRY
ncbi:MAG TPA: hypothetical protein VHJ17_07475 [Thermomonospora sp.]|nr:hypothetical protein [Thermomonospora sp.]